MTTAEFGHPGTQIMVKKYLKDAIRINNMEVSSLLPKEKIIYRLLGDIKWT